MREHTQLKAPYTTLEAPYTTLKAPYTTPGSTSYARTGSNVFRCHCRTAGEFWNYDDRGQGEGHGTPFALPPVIIIPDLSRNTFQKHVSRGVPKHSRH
jgi:hypothetical protein